MAYTYSREQALSNQALNPGKVITKKPEELQEGQAVTVQAGNKQYEGYVEGNKVIAVRSVSEAEQQQKASDAAIEANRQRLMVEQPKQPNKKIIQVAQDPASQLAARQALGPSVPLNQNIESITVTQRPQAKEIQRPKTQEELYQEAKQRKREAAEQRVDMLKNMVYSSVPNPAVVINPSQVFTRPVVNINRNDKDAWAVAQAKGLARLPIEIATSAPKTGADIVFYGSSLTPKQYKDIAVTPLKSIARPTRSAQYAQELKDSVMSTAGGRATVKDASQIIPGVKQSLNIRNPDFLANVVGIGIAGYAGYKAIKTGKAPIEFTEEQARTKRTTMRFEDDLTPGQYRTVTSDLTQAKVLASKGNLVSEGDAFLRTNYYNVPKTKKELDRGKRDSKS